MYHGRTLKVEKRFSQGLSWLTSYTFGKMIDDAGNPQNSYNRHAERSLSDFHNKHRMTLSSTYELPFGNGRTKNTRMGESKNVQFRAEFFNALNPRELRSAERPAKFGELWPNLCRFGLTADSIWNEIVLLRRRGL